VFFARIDNTHIVARKPIRRKKRKRIDRTQLKCLRTFVILPRKR